jgi:hypothetical protein
MIGNIYITHEKEKKKAFENIVKKDNWDGCLIYGAQYRLDTCFLYTHFAKEEKPVVLVDIREDELNKFQGSNEKVKKLNYDLSYSFAEDKSIEALKESGCVNPLVYDNLSGSVSRFSAIDKLLNEFPLVTAYIHTRGGTHYEAFEQFYVHDEHYLSPHNCLLTLSNNKELGKITRESSTLVGIDNGQQCPHCNARGRASIYSRCTMLLRYRCKICGWEWGKNKHHQYVKEANDVVGTSPVTATIDKVMGKLIERTRRELTAINEQLNAMDDLRREKNALEAQLASLL